MKNYTSESFGLLIAFLIPGSIILWGLSRCFPDIDAWIGTTAAASPTVGDVLYATIAAIFCGLVASTIRWLLIDQMLYFFGVKRSDWNLKLLHERMDAFDLFLQANYRYYQFYANCLIAVPFASICYWSTSPVQWSQPILLSGFGALFLLASRDTLTNYHEGVRMMLEKAED